MQSEENVSIHRSEFWGICCESGKKYSQVVTQRFHLTMAALDPTVVPTSPVVSLLVERGGCQYLLCSLKPGNCLQVNLNLYFDKGEKVTFSLKGQGKIHLSGYHIYGKNETTSEVSVKTAIASKKAVESPKKDAKKSESESDDDMLDQLDDSSDEESEEKEDLKKDSQKLKSYKRMWSSLTQSEEEEESDSDSDEDSKESSKKKANDFQSKKKLKQDTSTPASNKKPALSSTMKKSAEVISLDEDEPASMKKSLNSSGAPLNSSIGRTPMPKKKSLNSNMAKTTPGNLAKKVNFADEDSSDSDTEAAVSGKKDSLAVSPSKTVEMNTSGANTDSKKKKKKKKSKDGLNTSNVSDDGKNSTGKGGQSSTYSNKLSGGLEYTDIRMGNGPIAKKGKLVHVYYTGTLENNKVFDSREIGNKPFSFKLGTQQVITGWDLGIEGMKVGGKRKLKVPANLGYQNKRMGPIPPNSTLYFTVELKAVS